MDFDRWFGGKPETEQVQEKKKYQTFTVREIGGPDEIVKWRREQAIKEESYRMRLAERDSRIAAFQAETNQTLDSPTVERSTWNNRLSFALGERARLKKLEDIPVYHYEFKEPELNLWQKMKRFCKRVWQNANFS